MEPHRSTAAVQQRRPSRAVGIVFLIIAFIATACAWAGLSFKDLLSILHF